jgi:hypothetical protein
MKSKSLKRTLVLAGSILILVLAFAPASFAGGCDDDEEDCGGGGGSAPALSGGDSGSAEGGVQTGFGSMATSDSSKILLPMSLVGGGVLLLSIAGGLAVRRQNNQ